MICAPSRPLPLGRRAIAAWSAYAQAESDRDRATVARYAGLGERQIAALERLRTNLDAAGPQERWIAPSEAGREQYALREDAMDAVLAGLIVDLDDAALFAKALRPRTMGILWALEAALRARARAPQASAAQHGAPDTGHPTPESQEETMVIETAVTENGNGRAPHELTAPGLIERMRALVDLWEIDLAGPVFVEQHARLAQELGTTRYTVAGYLSRIRKERGIAPRRGSATKETGDGRLRRDGGPETGDGVPVPRLPSPVSRLPSPVAPQAPPPSPVAELGDPMRRAAAEMVRVVLEEGLRHLALGPLEGPVRALIALAIGGGAQEQFPPES